MAINPCIEDSNCVGLEVNASSNLVASLIISDDAGNCAECRVDGLFVPCSLEISADACNAISEHADGIWAGAQAQQVFGVTVAEVTVGPIVPGDGLVTARSGTLNFSNPSACAGGVILKAVNAGTTQVTDVSAGGRVVTTYEDHTGGGFVGGPYGLYENTGFVAGDHAWTGTWGTTIDGIGAAGSGTLTWRETIQVTAGTCTSATFRPMFLYIWVVAMA